MSRDTAGRLRPPAHRARHAALAARHLQDRPEQGKVTRMRHYVDTAKHSAAAAGTDTTTSSERAERPDAMPAAASRRASPRAFRTPGAASRCVLLSVLRTPGRIRRRRPCPCRHGRGSGHSPVRSRSARPPTMSPEITRPCLVIRMRDQRFDERWQRAFRRVRAVARVRRPASRRSLPWTSFAKPLKAAGAGPPESELSFHHCAPQNSTCDADGGVFVADDEVFCRTGRRGESERHRRRRRASARQRVGPRRDE